MFLYSLLLHLFGSVKLCITTFLTVTECCDQARKLFGDVQQGFSKLASIVPGDQYYRFHDHWRFSIQRLAFLASLVVYLESGQMAMIEQVAQMIGGKSFAKHELY